MSTAKDARANFMALMADAPEAVIGSGPMALNAKDVPERQTTIEDRVRRDFAAAANEAPGAVVGSVGCCCPEDTQRHLLDTQTDCGKHGDDLRRYLYLMMVQRLRLHRNSMVRPRGLGRA